MDWRDVPVFLINHDNLTRGFKQQVEWLTDVGMTSLTVIDNGSTYQPLLDYYEGVSFRVIRQTNRGPYVFWETNLHEQQEMPYIVSDADCVPSADCPKDLVEKMLFVLEKHPTIVRKVGPSIRIDNLPDVYAKKEKVIAHESQFWTDFQYETHEKSPWVVEGTPPMYDSIIDTTFAMYPRQSPWPGWHHHYRLAPPYSVEHKPWYEDSSNPSEECLYYRAHVANGWSCWETR